MKKQSGLNAYYSASPESRSAKMEAYIQFMHAAHAGDAEMANKVGTDDITWDINAGSEVPNGLPWIGLFKGKAAIIKAADSMKGLEVLSREYYLILEQETQLIIFAKDTVKCWGMIIPNINFSNAITFRGDKIAYIKTVEDSSRFLVAYQTHQAAQAIKDWSNK
ncbi:MAG: hypothetical protein EXR81_06415 [Gammaproteobacteria bacterium]|nr:hypothetical protein [Gammaproteobacteria bacterium]